MWTFHGHALLEFPPVVAYGRVYITNFAGTLFALNAGSGKTLWKHVSGYCGWASPADQGLDEYDGVEDDSRRGQR